MALIFKLSELENLPAIFMSRGVTCGLMNQTEAQVKENKSDIVHHCPLIYTISELHLESQYFYFISLMTIALQIQNIFADGPLFMINFGQDME